MITPKEQSWSVNGGRNLGAIPKADVTAVFQSQDLDKKFGEYEGVFKDQLDSAFRREFGGSIANREYSLNTNTVPRQGPGTAFAATGMTYNSNSVVTVTESAGNWAMIGTGEWVPTSVLSTTLITNEVILSTITALIPEGVSYALAQMANAPKDFLSGDGVTYEAIRKLEDIAANYVIDQTAATLGF